MYLLSNSILYQHHCLIARFPYPTTAHDIPCIEATEGSRAVDAYLSPLDLLLEYGGDSRTNSSEVHL